MALGGILWNQGVFPLDGTIGPVGPTEAPATVPDPPTDLNEPEVGNREAIIFFTPGSDGGSPIINYQYSLDGGEFIEFDPAVTESPVTIDGLYNNTTYTITLKAVNSVGASAPSTSSVTVTPRGLPDAPEFISYVRTTNIQILFRDGGDGGNPIIGYVYGYSLDAGETFTQVDASSGQISISGPNKILTISAIDNQPLVNEQAYIFYLRARNRYGPGDTSDYIDVSIVGPPEAPTLESFTNGNASVDITFTPGNSNGSPITNYKYSLLSFVATPPEGPEWSDFSIINDTDSPVTITGLSNNLLYQIKFKAVNIFGDSAESNVLPLVGPYINPFNAPSAPTNLVATPGNAFIDVSFNGSVVESESGYTIINYEYSFNNGVSYTQVDPSDPNPPVKISGLINGTTYSIRLRGIAANTEDPSITIKSGQSTAVSAMPFGPPLPPTNLVAAPGNGTASISFTAGSNGGRPITSYQYSVKINAPHGVGAFSEFANTSGTTSPFSFTGLTNGTTYTYKFRAVTTAGTSSESAEIQVIPSNFGTPVIQKGVADNGAVYIYFTQPYGTATNYKYTVNGGTSYTTFSPAVTTSPLRIGSLINGTPVNIQIVAIGTPSTQVSGLSNVITVTPTDAANDTGPALYYEPNTYNSGAITNSGTGGTVTSTFINVSTVTGPTTKVFNFTGSNYISFGRYNFGPAITLTSWIKPSTTSTINGLLANASAGQQPKGFKMGWNSWLQNNRTCYFEAGSGSLGSANATVANAVTYDRWQHYGCVFDQANGLVIFFINGIPINIGGITTLTGIGIDNAFNIGAFIGPSYYTKAQVGYVKVYKYLFNATDMLAEYTTNKAVYGL